MNYIGDWGRQFGLLAAGFKRFGCEESLQQDPIQHLFEVYVATNAAAEEDTGLSTEARRVVELLEARDPDTLAVWEKFRVLSIEAYNTMYARLHIKVSAPVRQCTVCSCARAPVRQCARASVPCVRARMCM